MSKYNTECCKIQLLELTNTWCPTLELGTHTTPSHWGQQLSWTSWAKWWCGEMWRETDSKEWFPQAQLWSQFFLNGDKILEVPPHSQLLLTWSPSWELKRSSSQESASFPQTSSSVRLPPLTWVVMMMMMMVVVVVVTVMVMLMTKMVTVMVVIDNLKEIFKIDKGTLWEKENWITKLIECWKGGKYVECDI